MKVSLNSKLQSNQQTSFKGFEVKKDEYGERYYEWSFPYDSNRYNCYLDIFPVVPDKNGDYENNTFDNPYRNFFDGSLSFQLNPNPENNPGKKNKVYLDQRFGHPEDAPFAYHYRLVPKDNSGKSVICFDAGDLLDKRTFNNDMENVYNIVVPNALNSGKAGAAILIGADNYDVRFKYDKNGNIVKNPDASKGLNTFKNFANHVGGSLAGVHKALQEGRLDPYSKIFLLPHTSGDRTSSAGYWLESGFQFSSAVDNVDNFTKFQNELFAKGKTLVADSALTSEGISGIHIQSILKNGEDDVFFDWFKCDPLKNMTAKIGAFGVKTEFIRHKLINPPAFPEQDNNGHISFKPNKLYKKDEPTYIQVYSADAASPEQIADSTLKIDKYGNPNGTNPLKYGTHNDITIAYNFPIDFDAYKYDVSLFNQLNSQRRREGKPYISVDSYMGTRLLTKFDKFEFENKIDGGFYTWDANVDLVKFNYAESNEDVETAMNLPIEDRPAFYKLKQQKRCEVLDYAVSSLKYWTRKTNQSLNLYVAQNLQKIDSNDSHSTYEKMKGLIESGVLPRKIYDNIDETVVQNVLNDDYILHGAESVENYHNTILDGLMNYPLESTEVGKDILALFSTPYITNRATRPEFVGESRLELLRQRNPHLTKQYEDVYNLTTNMYTGAMYNFAQDVIEEVNKKLPRESKLNKGADASDFGKYVLPIITQEIAKYAVVKGLFPDVKVEIDSERGGIKYDYDALRKKTLKSLDIDNTSQKNEAEELMLYLRAGIGRISPDDKKKLVKAVYKMIENTNLKSFQMAEMIVDRTKSGIDWRIDALKDFSNMDGLRNKADTFEDNWEQVVQISKALVDGIKSENKNAYVVAEITDEVDLHKLGDGESSERFVWKKDPYSVGEYTDHNGKHDIYNYDYRNDITKKLLRESGIDAVANYAFYFTNIAAIFGKRGDNGIDWNPGQYYRIYNIFSRDKSNEFAEDFLYSGPYDSIIKTYSFVDNHDKPRINHVLSLDMQLFLANLNDSSTDEARWYRKRAYEVLNPDKDSNDEYAVQNYDYSYVSAMAVARGEALNNAFGRALDYLSKEQDSHGRYIVDRERKGEMLQNFKRVVAEFAAGRYNNINYEANNFGVEEVHKVLQLVMDEYSKKYGINQNMQDTLFNKTFEMALDPAMNNSLGMDKFLVNAPGIPTINAGDELGATGWERKSRNETVKNRSAVAHEFAEKYGFIKNRKAQKEAIYMLRSRPVLHALNDGAPYLLKKQYVKENNDAYLTTLLRYATDGNAVLSIFNASGITHDYDKYTDPFNNGVNLKDNKIDLTSEGADGTVGLPGGLEEGMTFVNAFDENDKYKVFHGAGNEYYLAKNRECSVPITLTDSTLTLYYADQNLMHKEKEFMKRVNKVKKYNESHEDNPISFCGSRTYENKVYNVAPVNYNKINVKQNTTGLKFEAISK